MRWSPKNHHMSSKCLSTFIKVKGLHVCIDLCMDKVFATKCLQWTEHGIFIPRDNMKGISNSRGILFFFNRHLQILLAQWNRNKPNGQWIITSMSLQLYNIKGLKFFCFFFFNVMIQGKIISHFVSCVFNCFMSINFFVSN